MNENPENFQYNSCIARGICSVNPRTSSLIIILVVYLRLAAKYCLKLLEKEPVPAELKELILNTVAITVTGQEFNEQSFKNLISEYKKLLPMIFTRCNELFDEDFFKNEPITSSELFTQTENIVDAIKLGERILKKVIFALSTEIRDLQQIVMIVAKSLSISLLDLESFGHIDEKCFLTILELLDSVSTECTETNFLKSKILESVKVYKTVTEKLRKSQEERYGKQNMMEVSYSTTAAKVVLVVGSNIRELETVLEKLKDFEIDVYTHDEMMLAHTFPKFSEYKRLKGQYGQGIESCLIDFATFPGPIILTKHSLHNIDNLYRGRLFTTDYTVPQGVIKIENDDYGAVIDASLLSKGFKKGKKCESIKIGYDYEYISEKIDSKINSGIKRIFIISADNFSKELKNYFEKLIKSTFKDTLIISFSYKFEYEKFIHINTCFDNYATIRIFDKVKTYGLPITVFIPKCSMNTISEMIYFSEDKNTKVYSGKCTPIILNPSIMQTLKNIFNINSITVVSDDLRDITDS